MGACTAVQQSSVGYVVVDIE
eukprot:COSAG06_NODE_46833_length_344_cov_0.477551_1_plen_20_part_10